VNCQRVPAPWCRPPSSGSGSAFVRVPLADNISVSDHVAGLAEPPRRRSIYLMSTFIRQAMLALAGLAAPMWVGAQNATAALLRESASCATTTVAGERQRECHYAIGRSLRFSVVGVGEPDAAVNVLKSDADSDFYLSFGIQHGCAIVWPTGKAPERFQLHLAFVSPRTGRVYDTWQQCRDAASRQ
jgi:hypothetical protein